MRDGDVMVRGARPRPLAHPADGLEAMLTPEPWMQEGLCAQTDPEAFFPERGGSTREAKAICNGRPGSVNPPRSALEPCPVKEQCLAYALRNGEQFGIWGGLSQRERRKLQRELQPVSQQAAAVRKGAAALLAKRGDAA